MKKALIIVDVQNDFVEEGSLAVSGGVNLAARISGFLMAIGFDRYDVIATTQDWHIDPGSHFSTDPDFIDSWPVHCVADSEGAEIVESLREALMGHVDIAVRKGMFTASYSGFDGVLEDGGTLEEALRELDVTNIDVVGIATDHCVYKTALDGAKAGFVTTVLPELTVGINSEQVEKVLTEFLPAAGVKLRDETLDY
jgi:nicotinamidase/pyrazinamidase